MVAPGVSRATDPVTITVLSNRADLISGGDALVAVDTPSPDNTTITLDDGPPITSLVRIGATRLEGLLTGMTDREHVLKATLPDGSGAQITITNHPNGGPVFAGPQVQPWVCGEQTALDAQCNEPARYSFFYKSTDFTKKGLQPYDPASSPTDLATTTTDQGVTVPFIVRMETGYQDRDQYKIATLIQPHESWTALEPQAQWNHKLLITHGGGCGNDFGSWAAPSVTNYGPADLLGLPVAAPEAVLSDSAEYALGAGFAVMSTALNNNGHNCNLVVQAESMMMAKERLVEQYGELRYTIGTGCSGGSLTQQWVANAYPGIYQGLLPTCSFPDTYTSATQVLDYHLLRAYFEDRSRWGSGVIWTEPQMAAVEGHITSVNAQLSDDGYFFAFEPTGRCWPLTGEQLYSAETNPGGVRCGIDYAINVLGPRSADVWSAAEQEIERGFAGLALDNVGVMYGLQTLQEGKITPEQFVDLNVKVGGLDIDIKPVPQRLAADQPALANTYRSGSVNVANNLHQVAIIDCRGPDPGAAHDSYRAFAVRARLDREHGGHGNQLIWEGPTVIIGDTHCHLNSLIAMDRWLAAIEQDTSAKPIEQKIVADKPADLGDQCWDGVGHKVLDTLCPPGVVPVYGTPRTVAGDAITTDTQKCQLKPLDRADLGVVPFTDDQWAQLQALFPDGVCDFSRPGVSQGPTIPWLTYQDADGQVIYGGSPLPVPPASTPIPPE